MRPQGRRSTSFFIGIRLRCFALLLTASGPATAVTLDTPLQRTCRAAMRPVETSPYRVSSAEIERHAELPDSFSVQQVDNHNGIKTRFHFTADLDSSGRLTIDAELVNHQRLVRSGIRGKLSFSEMIQHFGDSAIQAVQTDWSFASDNHFMFTESLHRGHSPLEAAFATWSGQRLKEHGFMGVSRIWMEPLSELGTEEVRQGLRQASLEDFTIHAIFDRDPKPEADLEVSGPLAALWSEDEKEVWVVDRLFGYRLGLRFSIAGIEILIPSQTRDPFGTQGALEDLKDFVGKINEYQRQRPNRSHLNFTISRRLNRALSTIRPLRPQSLITDFQLSLLGLMAAKQGLILESVSSRDSLYQLTFQPL